MLLFYSFFFVSFIVHCGCLLCMGVRVCLYGLLPDSNKDWLIDWYIVSPFARPIPSVRPSVCPSGTPEHCENGDWWHTVDLYLLWAAYRKSYPGYSGTYLRPHMTTTPSPKLGVGNPQSKLASQIAAKWYQIQELFVLTACGNLPAPYPTVPSSTPYGYFFPQNWSS